MKYTILIALILLSNTCFAQEITGTVDHEIYRQESLPPESIIWVQPREEARGTANIDFYGRKFVEIFKSKFPNTYWDDDLPEGVTANNLVTFKVVAQTDGGTYERKIYSQEPKGIKCRENPLGLNCDYEQGSKKLSGTVEETYLFYKFAILLSWYFPNSEKAAFTSMGTMLADTAQGNTHCSKIEAFAVVSNEMMKRIVADRPLEARYSIHNAKTAGCGPK